MARAKELTEGAIMDRFFAEEKTLRSDYEAPAVSDPGPDEAPLRDAEDKVEEKAVKDPASTETVAATDEKAVATKRPTTRKA